MTADPNREEPDKQGSTLLQQFFELWLRPELEARGADRKPEEIDRSLVIFKPGQRPKVLIEAEAQMIVRGRATRAIEVGEQVTEADLEAIESLVPHDIDPNAGWIGFVRFKNVYTLAFDFRQRKGKAQKMVDLAEEFLAAARLAVANDLKAPMVDLLFSAAELAAVAQMTVLPAKPPKAHDRRKEWFESWVELGNAPSDHGKALADLAQARPPARYGQGSVPPLSNADLDRLVNQVADMVEYAKKEITNRPGR
jgi:hypothetical protein